MTKSKDIKIFPYGSSQELGRILGKDGTLKILFILDEEGKRYKDIVSMVNIKETSLLRRLKVLQSLRMIKKKPITSERRNTHEYVLTRHGIKLMKFVISYEKDMSKEIIQKVVNDFERHVSK